MRGGATKRGEDKQNAPARRVSLSLSPLTSNARSPPPHYPTTTTPLQVLSICLSLTFSYITRARSHTPFPTPPPPHPGKLASSTSIGTPLIYRKVAPTHPLPPTTIPHTPRLQDDAPAEPVSYIPRLRHYIILLIVPIYHPAIAN